MKINAKSISLKKGYKVILRSPVTNDTQNFLKYVLKLHKESSDNLNSSYEYIKDTLTENFEKQYILKKEQQPNSFMISAFLDDNSIIGNITVEGENKSRLNHCGMVAMGILKTYQCIGLGKILLTEALEQAIMIGLSNIMLRVRTFNTPAIKLYEKFGFQKMATLKQVAKTSYGLSDEFIYQKINTSNTVLKT